MIRKTLYHEGSKKQFIERNTWEVTPMLRKPNFRMTLNERQQYLLDETIRGLECEAYRAATVMGWNLAYDYILQWIDNHHLAQFNRIMAKYQKKPISHYADFTAKGAPDEFQVFDICRGLKLISGTLHAHLCQYLRHSKDFTHGNFRTPSPARTNSYLEQVLDIITKPPFHVTPTEKPQDQPQIVQQKPTEVPG